MVFLETRAPSLLGLSERAQGRMSGERVPRAERLAFVENQAILWPAR